MNLAIFFQRVKAHLESAGPCHSDELLEHANAGGSDEKHDILTRRVGAF